MTTATAPAKVILLGEHAVVYGEPAVAAAVGLRTRVTVRDNRGGGSFVNGFPLTAQYHVHLRLAVDRLLGGRPVHLETMSPVPSAAGLGSSAALTVAVVRALTAHAGTYESEEQIAREAYEIEWRAQGGQGSPTDTSVSTHGGGVLVSDTRDPDDLLWTMRRGERAWHLHHLDMPPLKVVIGNTGERGRTAEQVAKVARFVKRTGLAKEIIRELGAVTRRGVDALAAEDPKRLGETMDAAHNALTMLGVSTKRLERAVTAAREAGALGAKLTGSGGGGSMIALPDGDPRPIVKALKRVGVDPMVATLGAPGARLEADP